MGAQIKSGKKGRITDINITPMVDVMLVLLVIMMVSAKYIVAQSYQIELPKVASKGESVSSTVEVLITKDGEYVAQERLLKTDADLGGYFSSETAKAEDVNLIIRADAEARHGSVVRVIDVAKQHGIYKFAINVQRE